MEIDREALLAAMTYNKKSGICRWRTTRKGVEKVNQVAGYVDKQGKRWIRFSNGRYRSTHLIWFYVTGTWPPVLVDHEDLNVSNDKWRNLRLATHAQNHCNLRKSKRNTSGYKGVSFCKKKNKFEVRINFEGKCHRLGYYKTARLGHAVYKKASQRYHGAYGRIS
jgi:hypothetical protein